MSLSKPPSYEPTDPAAKPCRDLWFDDGTVVFCAENTLYRIFPGILSKNSSVFYDMFSLPLVATEENYEGCPLIRVPDPEKDMTFFLKALYDASFFDISSINDFDVVAGVLRLGTKYDVPFLRTRSIQWLRARCPKTLGEWVMNESLPREACIFKHLRFEVVKLARECHVPIILPVALFTSSNNVPALLDSDLDLSDKLLCLKAKSQFESLLRPVLYGFIYGLRQSSIPNQLTVHSLRCPTKEKCRLFRGQYLQRLEIRLHTLSQKGTVYSPFTQIFPWEAFRKDVCESCYWEAKELYAENRRAFWEMLPEIFELGSWEECEANTV